MVSFLLYLMIISFLLLLLLLPFYRAFETDVKKFHTLHYIPWTNDYRIAIC